MSKNKKNKAAAKPMFLIQRIMVEFIICLTVHSLGTHFVYGFKQTGGTRVGSVFLLDDLPLYKPGHTKVHKTVIGQQLLMKYYFPKGKFNGLTLIEWCRKQLITAELLMLPEETYAS